MANWVEKDTSRPYATQGRDVEIVTRRFVVFDVLPWEATRLADPPLPQLGDPLPGRTPSGVGGRGRGGRREDFLIQVRDIQANYAPGSTNNSEVVITYRSGPNWREQAGRRLVEWSMDSGAESATTFVDNAANYVPEGLQTCVPTITMRARLEGGAVPNARVPLLVGKFNDAPFRLFWPHTVQFASISSRGITSHTPYHGKNDLEYEFVAKPDGWGQRRPKKDARGNIILGTDGLPVMTEHQTGEECDFRLLFPNNFDPGFETFFDPTYPII